MSPPLRLAVLLSGSGRTLQNLLDQERRNDWPARVVVAISNRADAYGLVRAREHGVPTAVVTRKENPGDEFSRRIFDACRDGGVDLVCLAGFLQLLAIPPDFSGRVVNIHPSLLPKFGGPGMYGLHVHEAVLAAGESESGCTIHFCTDQYDQGQVILQKRVPVLSDDSPESLADRVFAAECVAYPEAICLLAAR
ncbi:MAG: phosphoribosylglycinamide formyltransferase [Gemmataceae bacterium]|nr:phosphoribosylglycinamide formyltransferase [Gemmataceae bacterium]